jgi:cytochrome c-type biogenesis protein CcmH/NrfG
LDPKDVLALTLLGKIRLQQGDRAAARELFRRALALDPRNPDALQGMSAL